MEVFPVNFLNLSVAVEIRARQTCKLAWELCRLRSVAAFTVLVAGGHGGEFLPVITSLDLTSPHFRRIGRELLESVWPGVATSKRLCFGMDLDPQGHSQAPSVFGAVCLFPHGCRSLGAAGHFAASSEGVMTTVKQPMGRLSKLKTNQSTHQSINQSMTSH